MNDNQSSESGFKNYKPKGREYRQNLADKHKFERSRLANRREGFQRHDPCTNPLYVKETAAGYMDGILSFKNHLFLPKIPSVSIQTL